MKNAYYDRETHYAVALWSRCSANRTYGKRYQLYALIDKPDLPIVAAIKGTWLPVKGGRTNYARFTTRSKGIAHVVWMHRLILACPDDLEADHGNHDGLDNRRENLAAVTHAYNVSPDRRRKTAKPRATLCGKCKRYPRRSDHAYCDDCKQNYEIDRRARIHREKAEARRVRDYLNPQ